LAETRFLGLDLVLTPLKSEELAGLIQGKLKAAGRTPGDFQEL